MLKVDKHEDYLPFQKYNIYSGYPLLTENAKFIFVKAKPKLRRERLLQRDHLNLSSDYEKRMAARFDTPTIPHEVLQNNQEGRKHIEEQLNILMKKLSL